MPIYEYHCDDCDTTFEKFWRSVSAAKGNPAPSCPNCDGTHTERKLSAFSSGSAGSGIAGGQISSPPPTSPFR